MPKIPKGLQVGRNATTRYGSVPDGPGDAMAKALVRRPSAARAAGYG